MSNITGNEPAMPFFEYNEKGYGNTVVLNMLDGSKQFLPYQPGLTIRQELAARAMQGILTMINPNEKGSEYVSNSFDLLYDKIAAHSVIMADALLTELNKS